MGINKRLFTGAADTPFVAAENFNTALYTGNGGADSVAVGFQSELTLIKARDTAGKWNVWYDIIRGATNMISSNSTGQAQAYGSVTPTSTGFDIGSASAGDLNTNGEDYVSWNWKAGGAAVSNTDGTITSQVSVNLAAGFSIATYTGNGTQNATIGHSLESAPDMVIIKNRGQSDSWFVSHVGLDSNQFVELDQTAVATTNSDLNHQRLSTTFKTTSASPHDMINESGETYVMYSFKNIAGYQKFGTYTWTGSNYTAGAMVSDLGFTPRFVMIKGKNEDSNFSVYDSTRGSGSQRYRLAFNTSAAEVTTGYQGIGFDSNGFSAIVGADGNTTASGGLNKQNGVYLYWAIA